VEASHFPLAARAKFLELAGCDENAAFERTECLIVGFDSTIQIVPEIGQRSSKKLPVLASWG